MRYNHTSEGHYQNGNSYYLLNTKSIVKNALTKSSLSSSLVVPLLGSLSSSQPAEPLLLSSLSFAYSCDKKQIKDRINNL